MTRGFSLRLSVGRHEQNDTFNALLATYYDGIAVPEFLRRLSAHREVPCLETIRSELAPSLAYVKPAGVHTSDLRITRIELTDNFVLCRLEVEMEA